MEALIAILGFIIVFVLPCVILLILVKVKGTTRDTRMRVDALESKIDLLLDHSQIDLSNLRVPKSLALLVNDKLMYEKGFDDARSLIELRLGVTSKQAQVILDRFTAEQDLPTDGKDAKAEG